MNQPLLIGTTGRFATFSECRRYRYALWRLWDAAPFKRGMIMFVGLNPSTADEDLDDPTTVRMEGFAKSWGYGGFVLVNLFAFRATNPRDMINAEDPIGPRTDYFIQNHLMGAKAVVACWGTCREWAPARARADAVYEMLAGASGGQRFIHCLGINRGGSPKHPLYVRGDTPLQEYLPRAPDRSPTELATASAPP